MLQNKKVSVKLQEEFIFNVPPSFRDKCSKSQKLSDLAKINREITRNLVYYSVSEDLLKQPHSKPPAYVRLLFLKDKVTGCLVHSRLSGAT